MKNKSKMLAFIHEKYGPPEVLVQKEIEKPTPKEGEVLVKVHASSLNAADLDYLRGHPLIRIGGLRKPKYNILGSDIAGKVETVGSNVLQLQPDDEVFADTSVCGFGAFAEYVCIPEKEIMKKSVSMTFEQASTYPQAGILAIQGLRDKKQIQLGQKVLINGAGGGVGSFAIQIAKYFGAEVTGVDSTEKLDMMRSIGADHVMDYTQEPHYTKSGERYDLILDVIAHRSFFDYRRALTSKGSLVIIGGSFARIFQVFFLGSLFNLFGNKKTGILMWKPNKKNDLDFLIDTFESGKVVPIIDRCFPFDDLPNALRYLEDGHALGKIVITFD